MAEKHFAMFKSLVIQEILIKITLKFPFTPVRIAKIKKQMIPYSCKDMGKEEHLFNVSGNSNLYRHYENQYSSFFKY